MEKDLRKQKVMATFANRRYCYGCNSYVRVLTPRETGERFKANWAEFSRLVADGVVHRIHDQNGQIQICSSSIHGKQRASEERFLVLKSCSIRTMPARASKKSLNE